MDFHIQTIPLCQDHDKIMPISDVCNLTFSCQAAVLSTCNRFELYFASPEQKQPGSCGNDLEVKGYIEV